MISSLTPEIIYEDKDIIVCHKPTGVPTQSSRIGTKDMVSILKNHLIKNTAKKTASREPYLAVIHRLDQPVEGLLVFAKTPAAAKELSRQLTTSGFGKYYRAQALGIFEHNEGTLEDYLVKDGRTNTSRVCKENVPDAKYARLHYKVIHTGTLPSGEPFSQLEIHLDTGRHHQIRVQFAHAGHPLIGDRKYGTAACTSRQLMLCACRLEFTHPTTGKKWFFIYKTKRKSAVIGQSLHFSFRLFPIYCISPAFTCHLSK